MGGEKSSSKPVNQVVVEPRISANRFRFLSQIEPQTMSPEMVERNKAWEAKRDALHARMAALNRLEAVSRKSDERKAETFLAALEGGQKKPVEVMILSADQEKMVHEAFVAAGQSEGEQTALRESFMGSINEQEIFVGLYEQWKNEYKNDPKLHDKTLEEYVQMKGIEHIKLYRKQLIRERTNLFYDNNAKTDNITDEEKAAQKDKFYKALDLYIQSNRETLAELNSLPEEEQTSQRKILMGKFVTMMNQNGFDKADKAKIEVLFNQIVGDLEHEVAIVEGFETACDEMILMAKEGVTEAQWKERRMNALKKKAAELQETPQQQNQPVYTAGFAADTVGGGPVYSEIRDIEKAGHIRFEPIPNKPNEYTIKFLALAENELFRPNIRIVYDPPDSKDMAHARFELQDEWADIDSKEKGAPFGATPSRTIDDPGKMVGGLNSLLLNYVINRKISLRTPINAAESPNQAIKDNVMTHIAERLLMPARMEENPLTDEQLKIFERFMTVVLRDDANSALNALEKRIQKVKEMIDKDEDIAYMKDIFMSEGSKVRTLGELIQELELRKTGAANMPKT